MPNTHIARPPSIRQPTEPIRQLIRYPTALFSKGGKCKLRHFRALQGVCHARRIEHRERRYSTIGTSCIGPIQYEDVAHLGTFGTR